MAGRVRNVNISHIYHVLWRSIREEEWDIVHAVLENVKSCYRDNYAVYNLALIQYKSTVLPV